MKISTKSRYGLRTLVDLAIHSAEEQVPLVHIAKRQNLSVNYLEQVFAILKKANIVKSVKGAQGGYILARPAREITVGDILRAIEGELLIVEEEVRKNESSMLYQNMQICLQREVWNKIAESVKQTIDQITLEDLTNDYRNILLNDIDMYYI
ncbi:MAG: Rrf2 family transcriptional regulator [Cellulosilyticum sp.]|nr:Rrf2 family transcriptional regulator [Cellulosilyticum sp.]